IGFHQEKYVQNFISTATSELKIDILPHNNTIYYKKHLTKIDALPAGIDFSEIHSFVEKIDPKVDWIKRDFDIDYEQVINGVDSIVHTQVHLERIHILDHFFETQPACIGKVVHVLIGSPSREFITSYKDLTVQLIREIDGLNWKYGEGSWNPVHFVHETV